MNSRQKRTLTAIFADPTRANVVWADIESLFRALGARVEEGNGSRIRFVLGERKATFHRPHPQPTTDKGAVLSVRRLLTESGHAPDEEESQ